MREDYLEEKDMLTSKIEQLIKLSANQVKDLELKAAYRKQLYAELLTLLRIPAPQLLRMSENAVKISEEEMDTGELILRLFNYSDHAIGIKKPTNKLRSMTKSQMKQDLPELYDILHNSEAAKELKAFEKELQDLIDME